MYSGLTLKPIKIITNDTPNLLIKSTYFYPIICSPIQDIRRARFFHTQPFASICHHLVHPLPHIFSRLSLELRSKLDSSLDLLNILTHVPLAERHTAVDQASVIQVQKVEHLD